jgi:hypothetical protein
MAMIPCRHLVGLAAVRILSFRCSSTTCLEPDTCQPSLCSCVANGGSGYDCTAELNAVCNRCARSKGASLTVSLTTITTCTVPTPNVSSTADRVRSANAGGISGCSFLDVDSFCSSVQSCGINKCHTTCLDELQALTGCSSCTQWSKTHSQLRAMHFLPIQDSIMCIFDDLQRSVTPWRFSTSTTKHTSQWVLPVRKRLFKGKNWKIPLFGTPLNPPCLATFFNDHCLVFHETSSWRVFVCFFRESPALLTLHSFFLIAKTP